jgi:hypothetical protein
MSHDTTLGVATDDVQIGVRLMLDAIVTGLDPDDTARLEGAAVALGGLLRFEGPPAADVIANAFRDSGILERSSEQLGRDAIAAGAPDGGATLTDAAADAIANVLEAVAAESGEALEALHAAEQRYRAARPYALSRAVRDSISELVCHCAPELEADYCAQLPEYRAGHAGEHLERVYQWLVSKEGQQR